MIGEHLFYHHLLQKQNASPILNKPYDVVWTSVFFLMCLAVLVFMKVTASNKVIKIIQSSFSINAMNELLREESSNYKLHSVILTLFYSFNFSFLLYKINSIYKLVFIQHDLFFQFEFILFIVLLFLGLKLVLNKLLQVLTNNKRSVIYYNSSSLKINQTLGLFLFPVLLVIEFANFNTVLFTVFSLLVILILVTIKWFRGVFTALIEERVGILQTFTYFCVLEVLPILVLVKYIIETF